MRAFPFLQPQDRHLIVSCYISFYTLDGVNI